MNSKLRAAIALAICLLTGGCAARMQVQTHTASVATALAPVVDQAVSAYEAANQIHQKRTDYEAVVDFDRKDVIYNPRIIRPLISDRGIELRLAIFKGILVYVQGLVTITDDVESPALTAASESLGSSITSLANDNPSESMINKDSRTEPAVTAIPAPAEAASTANDALSTGMNALAQYLVSRKVRRELPSKIVEMDPYMQNLCKALSADIDTIHMIERRDFDYLINTRTLFLREHSKELSPYERRVEILALPELAREQHDADMLLDQLRASIFKIELTHHALAAEAQSNNPESLRGKMGDLLAAANNLGRFYSSLPDTR